MVKGKGKFTFFLSFYPKYIKRLMQIITLVFAFLSDLSLLTFESKLKFVLTKSNKRNQTQVTKSVFKMVFI